MGSFLVQIKIKRVCVCSVCDGTGIVRHDAWVKLWESTSVDNCVLTHEEMLERMDSTDSLPPVEVVCSNCNGTRNVVVEESVDIENLAEMLKPYLKEKD
tara:strand:+ start:143 stop:439 length:297 start_codon:yes stop_codon:yes gene_type:complete